MPLPNYLYEESAVLPENIVGLVHDTKNLAAVFIVSYESLIHQNSSQLDKHAKST